MQCRSSEKDELIAHASQSTRSATPQEHLAVFDPVRFILSTFIIQTTGFVIILAADAAYYKITGKVDEFSCFKRTSNDKL